VNLVKSIRKVG